MKTELVFILDRSGSMAGLEQDTIGGFNSMIHKQKKEGEEVHVTTVLFDHVVEMLHERINIKDIQPLTEKEYYVRGCTALIDAIGTGIDQMNKWQERLSKSDKADKIIFVITTDGYENASKKYTTSEVKRMISYQKEKNWEFLFLGANIDAVKEASKFGIEEDRAVSFVNDAKGVALNYEVVSETLADMSVKPSMRVDGTWKKRIEKDYKARKK